MARTNIDIDEELVGWVMRRYRIHSKKDAVDFALRRLRTEPMSLADALAMEGTGWQGDLDEMRAGTAPRIGGAH